MIKEYKVNQNNPFLNEIIYEENNEIIGKLSYEEIYDRYEIDNFDVDLKHQNKHIGQKLLDYLIEKAKKNHIKNITLEVKETNLKAIYIYQKYNFKQVAKRSKYYNGTDGLLMELII